ncbi:branched-chain amino acid transporter [hydrocarbon metagenome]|uniref:Branched-chain amino acid transporter n=1 Tax=hydrocarbon metagenome TaxID=938273 RepID=A0A0W8E4H6_9ZZZZ
MENSKINSGRDRFSAYFKPCSLGLKASVPIAVGYIPIAITFGLVAKSSGIPDHIALLMSFIVFAGASQFVGVNLIALGTNPWEIILTTFILNLRHFLMSASLSIRIDPSVSSAWRCLMAFGVTDETFTVASLQKDKILSPYFIVALNMLAFLAWNAGTWAGIFLASGLPASLQASMGIALYAMFIGLLVPALKESRPILLVVLISIGINSALSWMPLSADLSAGWRIIFSTISAAFAAAIIFPAGTGRQENE